MGRLVLRNGSIIKEGNGEKNHLDIIPFGKSILFIPSRNRQTKKPGKSFYKYTFMYKFLLMRGPYKWIPHKWCQQTWEYHTRKISADTKYHDDISITHHKQENTRILSGKRQELVHYLWLLNGIFCEGKHKIQYFILNTGSEELRVIQRLNPMGDVEIKRKRNDWQSWLHNSSTPGETGMDTRSQGEKPKQLTKNMFSQICEQPNALYHLGCKSEGTKKQFICKLKHSNGQYCTESILEFYRWFVMIERTTRMVSTQVKC